jgi:hypothetical protein
MANRFWVGGTGTWDAANTTNWSATSGGAGGESVPTAADVVIFDGSSGADTVTIGAAAVNCLTFNASAFTGTFAFGTNKIVIAGNAATVFTGGTGYSVTGTPKIEFSYAGSTGTRTITSALPTEANVFDFYITGGTDTIALGTASGNYGTQDYTGFSGTRSSAQSLIYRNLVISSGMTLPTGGTQFVFSATSGTQELTSAGKTFDFSVNQNSPGATLQLQDNLTMGSTRTFTLTAGTLDLNNQTLNTGLFSSTNSNVRSIAFGTGNITVTGNSATVFTTATATNLTYTGTPTVNSTYSGSTGTRTIFNGATSGGSAALALNLNISAGSDATSIGGHFNNITYTGYSGTAATGNTFIYGNFLGSNTQTYTAGANPITFSATSAKTITTHNITIDRPIAFNGVGGTFAFQDALTQGSTRVFTITNGTVQLKNGVTSTVGSLTTSSTNQKFLQSTLAGTQATLSQATGIVSTGYLTIKDINATGGATFNAYTVNSNVNAGNNLGWDFFAQLGKTIYTRRKEKRVLI